MLRPVLFAVFASCFFGCTVVPPEAAVEPTVQLRSERPNIILIVADDLGAHDLGCYGNPVIQTPRINAMAEAGIRFTRAYAAQPICSPSRAAIQTGLHPARIGMTEHLRGEPPVDNCEPLIPPPNAGRLAYAYRTIGEALKDQDYRTLYVGKWHLGGQNYGPMNQGYDLSYAAGGQGLPRAYTRPFFHGNPYPELETIAGEDDYLTNAITTLAIESLPADGQPFFLDLNYYSPHVPIEGPDELVDKYEAIMAERGQTLPEPEYAAMVERIDEQVGRLLDTLTARGLIENTIILLTSDHGALTVEEVPGFDQFTPPTTNGPLRAGKGTLFEGGLRVPLIAYAPGRYTAAVINEPNVNLDYLPTITALAGTPETTPDGQVITALTGGVSDTTPRMLYWHFPHYSPQRGRPGAALISGNEKFIEWYSNIDSTYYFDLATDEGERYPVREANGRARELQRQLKVWRDSVGAKMMTVNPGFPGDNCN